MSIQITAMSDLGDALIIWGLDASMTSLNKWILLMTSLIWLWAIGVPLLVRYGMPRIFRYDLDWGRHSAETLLVLTLVDSLI